MAVYKLCKNKTRSALFSMIHIFGLLYLPPVHPVLKGSLNPKFGEGIDGYQPSWRRKELATYYIKTMGSG